MAVVVRLRRIGKNPKKRQHFRITVADEHRERDSKFIEELGFYNPVSGQTEIKKERLDYWIKNGARLSPTVKSLVKKSQVVLEKEAGNATDTAS